MTTGTEKKPVADRPKRAPTLYLIAAFKIGKGLLLLLVALGIFSLAGQDLQNDFEKVVRWFGLDPEKDFSPASANGSTPSRR